MPNPKKTKGESNNNESANIFNKSNYQFVIIGVCVVFVGYLLMLGGKSNDPHVFNENVIYGFRTITLAPIVIIVGFGLVCYGIIKKS